MKIRRTPTYEPDTEFKAFVPITKSYTDDATGKRYIQGVASGIAEDRDGERMSVNAIKGMVSQVKKGGVKLTSSHQQDWMTEIGETVEASHDPATDELVVKTELPPEGVDPIADKAWHVANTQRVGFSVGGKLAKSFYERNEVGKKRKVLDAINLRHMMLTKSPAYALSFAEAVAKTWDGDAPSDEDFTLDSDEFEADVEKATATGSWVGGGSDFGGGNVGRDSVGSGQRNAGSKNPKSKGMNTEDDGSNEEEEDKDLPEGKDQERHLACPNCGHEFAAELPVDPEERQVDETNDNDEDDQDKTGKSLTEETTPMSKLNTILDELRAEVAKQVNPGDPEPDDVAKTDDTTPAADELSDVQKVVAASHQLTSDRIEKIEAGVGEGFELIGKALKGIQDQIADLPQGRRSVARILPPNVGHEDGDVEKTVEKRIEEAESATDALKVLNGQHAAYAGR